MIMCGITAIFNIHDGAQALRKQALLMSKRIRHRGPDWSGIYQGKTAILAHERLSIVDPASGGQPLVSPDGKLILCVNGEIYNHQELRERLKGDYEFQTGSDCEVILALYKKKGIDFIEDLNGNGRWDTGSLVERRQPERVGMYVDDNNSEEITTKENWELVFDVDMNRIFGPVTMESMTAKINRDNEARLKAIAKKRAEDAANQKHNSGGGMGMGSMGGMGGMIGR